MSIACELYTLHAYYRFIEYIEDIYYNMNNSNIEVLIQ